eukprot:833147-Pleurochrysis_carterae.AAC.1
MLFRDLCLRAKGSDFQQQQLVSMKFPRSAQASAAIQRCTSRPTPVGMQRHIAARARAEAEP